MTIRQLELFVAVAETASFSKGAELMALTQSTVSQHIAALEKEMKTRLLDRTSRGIFLTTGGEVFLQYARRVLAECQLLQQAMSSFHGLEHASLVLGASNIPANYLVPRLLPVLNQQYPGIKVSMQSGDSRDVLKAVTEGKVELAITGARTEDDSLEFTPIIRDQLVLICSTDCSYIEGHTVSRAELLKQPLIVREDGSGTYQALLGALNKADIDPLALNIVARLGSNEAVRQAVLAGFGCAFVSDMSISSHLKNGEIKKLAVEGLTIERQLWQVRLKERSASPAAQAFSELLLAQKSFA